MTTLTAAVLSGRACKAATPCGRRCVLEAQKHHVYHGCNDEHCSLCHGDRFRLPQKGVRK